MRPILLFSTALLSIEVLLAGVSSNPFLRPSSSKKPIPAPTHQPSLPIKTSNAQKEVEFRGYCILNGAPLFCLYNKKSGHAEWVTIAESTYESFLIESFDLEMENLRFPTRALFSLTLTDSKSNAVQGSSTKAQPVPNTSSNRTTNQKPITRYMPPKPTTTPTLPSWLKNKKSASPLRFHLKSRFLRITVLRLVPVLFQGVLSQDRSFWIIRNCRTGSNGFYKPSSNPNLSNSSPSRSGSVPSISPSSTTLSTPVSTSSPMPPLSNRK